MVWGQKGRSWRQRVDVVAQYWSTIATNPKETGIEQRLAGINIPLTDIPLGHRYQRIQTKDQLSHKTSPAALQIRTSKTGKTTVCNTANTHWFEGTNMFRLHAKKCCCLFCVHTPSVGVAFILFIYSPFSVALLLYLFILKSLTLLLFFPSSSLCEVSLGYKKMK